MRLLLLAAAVLAAALLPLAPAGAAGQCARPGTVKSRIAAAPHNALLHDLVGAAARRFVDKFNAIPPRTVWRADRVLIVQNDADGRIHILLFGAGCFLTEDSAPPTLFMLFFPEIDVRRRST